MTVALVADPFDMTRKPKTLPIGPQTQDPEWMEDAACRDSELEFMPETERRGFRATEEPIEVCNGCPVKDQCLAYALEQPHSRDYGIYGGTIGSERRRLVGMA